MHRDTRHALRMLSGAVTALLCMAAGLAAVTRADHDPAQPIVVMASTSRVASLRLADLRRCFLGQPVVESGVRLIPFNHPPGSALREAFDATVLGMTLIESQRYWIDLRIRGGPRAPRTVSSFALLEKVLANLPGALGYVDAASAQSPRLRVLAIDGLRPEDRRYLGR